MPTNSPNHAELVEHYSEYDQWAWLYNQTAGPEYKAPQLAFLAREMLPLLPPQARLLDLCCGTGQLMQPMLDLGHQVIGLDGSQGMLDQAKQTAPKGEFVQADARHFKLEQPLDAVFCTSASLNHIPSLIDLQQVFERVYENLKPGGLFLFDVNHHTQMQRHWRGQAAEGEIKADYAWLITPHFDTNKAQGRFDVDIYRNASAKTGLKQSLLCKLLNLRLLYKWRLRALKRFAKIQPNWQHSQLSYPVYSHALGELDALLKQAGFQHVKQQNVSGDSHIDADHSAHFVCYKAPAKRNEAVA